MKEFFPFIKTVKYEGPNSKNDLSFKYYDKDKVILGKKMSEHLPFAMAWWHNLCATGIDMFGPGTVDKNFNQIPDSIEHAKAKVDAGFEFMSKLGIKYFCFHDVDLIADQGTLTEFHQKLDIISDYIKEKMKNTDIKCLWATANLFSHPRYANGAGSANQLNVYLFAAAQIKKALDLAVKLNATGYVFWGGREGYETLLNTDMLFEEENVARLMKLAVDYGRKIGFKGDFFIEPKPKEPTKHQYDYDAATSIGFLKKYGLDKDFKLNIEANHATLAGHSFAHELRVSAINNMLGSIDVNQGDKLIGWDTDEFPFDIYDTTFCMLELLRAGGLKNGGLNFDAKNRRPSNAPEDLFLGFILGMDAMALGLIKAAAIIEDGRIDEFVKNRYASFNSPLGKKLLSNKLTLEDLAQEALKLNELPKTDSGKEELLNIIVNNVLFK